MFVSNPFTPLVSEIFITFVCAKGFKKMKGCWMVLLIKTIPFIPNQSSEEKHVYRFWTSGAAATIEKVHKSLASLLMKVRQKLGLCRGLLFL